MSLPSILLSLVLSYGIPDSYTEVDEKIVVDAAKISIESKEEIPVEDSLVILKRSDNELEYACSHRCMPLLKYLVKSEKGLNPRMALFSAMVYKNYEAFEYILAHTEESVKDVLETCMENRDYEAFTIILKHRKLSKRAIKSGLDQFMSEGNIDFVKLCIEKGAVIKQYHFNKALLSADVKMCKYLLPFVNIHSNSEEALRLACHYGIENVCKLLIYNGADIHYEEEYPLRIAALAGNYEICRLLLDYGADLQCRYDDNIIAAKQGHNSRILRMFLG